MGQDNVIKMQNFDNEIDITMDAVSQNESFARLAVAAFITPLDPTISDMSDIKTAVSEAVTNAIIHGYNNLGGKVHIHCTLKNLLLTITIKDNGVGIDNIDEAMTPLYTSKPDMERSGMGFTVMETFMDSINVESKKNVGTTIVLVKKFDIPYNE